MKKSVKIDLDDASAIMESLAKKLPEMGLEEKVDVAARLKAIAKHCKEIDEAVKGDIEKKLKGKEGTVAGEIFKAVRKWIDKRVFDGKGLKQTDAPLYESWMIDTGNYETRFEPR